MWVTVPGVQGGRIWLYGIFHYEFNLKSFVKSDNERIKCKLILDLNFSSAGKFEGIIEPGNIKC